MSAVSAAARRGGPVLQNRNVGPLSLFLSSITHQIPAQNMMKLFSVLFLTAGSAWARRFTLPLSKRATFGEPLVGAGE